MQINKIDLHYIIEDIDYYLVSRKIEPIILEEWEKTINFLFNNNFPIEIKYFNNISLINLIHLLMIYY